MHDIIDGRKVPLERPLSERLEEIVSESPKLFKALATNDFKVITTNC